MEPKRGWNVAITPLLRSGNWSVIAYSVLIMEITCRSQMLPRAVFVAFLTSEQPYNFITVSIQHEFCQLKGTYFNYYAFVICGKFVSRCSKAVLSIIVVAGISWHSDAYSYQCKVYTCIKYCKYWLIRYGLDIYMTSIENLVFYVKLSEYMYICSTNIN